MEEKWDKDLEILQKKNWKWQNNPWMEADTKISELFYYTLLFHLLGNKIRQNYKLPQYYNSS